MAPHRRLDFLLGRTGRQIQDDVQRVKTEDITTAGSKERARPIVADMAHIVLPLLSTAGQSFRLRNSLSDLASSGGQIIEHPVGKRSYHRMGITEGQHQAPRFSWR